MLEVKMNHQNKPGPSIVTDDVLGEVASIQAALTTAGLTDLGKRWNQAALAGGDGDKALLLQTADLADASTALSDQGDVEDPGDLADALTAAAAELNTIATTGRGGESA